MVRTDVWEPSRGRNQTNRKLDRGLMTTAAKLSTLWGCMAEEEVQLTLVVLLKRSVTRPLPTSSRPSRLLPMTLLPVCGSRGMRTMKIRHVMVVVPVVIGAPVVTRMTSVMTKIRVVLLLGKVSRGQQRWCGQQMWICSDGK